jgi:hypothetical protein
MTGGDVRLFRAVANYMADRLETDAWAPFAEALSDPRHTEADTSKPRSALPVLRHLHEALRAARADAPEIVTALPASSQDWAPVYRSSEWSKPFNDQVAVLEIAGPGAVIHLPHATLGLMLCAPGLDYPRHAHPAVEVYVALSAGGAAERDADGVRHAMGPGDHSVHPPDTSHAFRTGSQPVVVAYAWCGDVMAPSWWKHDMRDETEPRRDARRSV